MPGGQYNDLTPRMMGKVCRPCLARGNHASGKKTRRECRDRCVAQRGLRAPSLTGRVSHELSDTIQDSNHFFPESPPSLDNNGHAPPGLRVPPAISWHHYYDHHGHHRIYVSAMRNPTPYITELTETRYTDAVATTRNLHHHNNFKSVNTSLFYFRSFGFRRTTERAGHTNTRCNDALTHACAIQAISQIKGFRKSRSTPPPPPLPPCESQSGRGQVDRTNSVCKPCGGSAEGNSAWISRHVTSALRFIDTWRQKHFFRTKWAPWVLVCVLAVSTVVATTTQDEHFPHLPRPTLHCC